jgi:hypothetical protein
MDRPNPTTWDDIEPGNEVELPDGSRKVVKSMTPIAGGLIEVEFEDGTRIRVRPDDPVTEIVD